jgi:hypothetical protein
MQITSFALSVQMRVWQSGRFAANGFLIMALHRERFCMLRNTHATDNSLVALATYSLLWRVFFAFSMRALFDLNVDDESQFPDGAVLFLEILMCFKWRLHIVWRMPPTGAAFQELMSHSMCRSTQ